MRPGLGWIRTAWRSAAYLRGHLASLTALTAGDAHLEGDVGDHLGISSAVSAVVAYCPAPISPFRRAQRARDPDPPASVGRGAARGSTGELARSASPRHRVHAGVPPHLILHGDRDTMVNHEQSRVLHEALSAVGAQSMYVLNHGETRSGRPSIRSPAPDVEGTQISNLETYANRPGVISPEGY